MMPFLLKNKQGNLTDIFLDICNVCDKTLKKKKARGCLHKFKEVVTSRVRGRGQNGFLCQ